MLGFAWVMLGYGSSMLGCAKLCVLEEDLCAVARKSINGVFFVRLPFLVKSLSIIVEKEEGEMGWSNG
ncbi:hypothetical protein NCCP2222_24950 [Sporosarcina sp. NCCP-2222]|nr:hypothetical protein NCCP2222_24950 [Sporosarcina sp. NCCP-2222]